MGKLPDPGAICNAQVGCGMQVCTVQPHYQNRGEMCVVTRCLAVAEVSSPEKMIILLANGQQFVYTNLNRS